MGNARMRRNVLVFFAVALVALGYSARADVLRVPYRFEPPEITRGGRGHRVAIRGLRSLGSPGEPVLPAATARILLPYGQAPDRVYLDVEKSTVLLGRFDIEHGRPVQPIGLLPASPDVRNEAIYRSSEPFPRTPIRIVCEQSLRGHRILIVSLYPLQYTPSSGKIVFHAAFDLVIETKKAELSLFERRQVKALQKRMTVDNPEALSTYPAAPSGQGSARYLLITSSELLPCFAPLLEWKEQKGLTCRAATVEDIQADGVGADLQEKIRNYIRECYLNLGTEYVLLGGDDEIVPARGVHGEVGGYLDENMPCDLYYAALDGNWNGDGDEIYGERTDGPGGGEVDLLAEVLVGRAPVGTALEAQNFVRKSVAYERDAGPNIAAMVWAGEQLDNLTYGSDSKESIASAMPSGYTHVRLYERTNSFSRESVMRALNASPHTVNHLGHSSETFALGLEVPDVMALTNQHPFFVYSQGCYAGAFDTATSGTGDCIGERFVTVGNAAFAAVFNSRFGWYSPGEATAGPSHYFDYEFFDAVFVEGRDEPSLAKLGAAHQDAKEDLIGMLDQPAVRWCYMELNLFGDPEVTLHNVLSKGILGFDAPKYQSSASPRLRVSDYDLNADHARPDIVTVRVSSDTEPAGEAILLQEAGTNSGTFFGRFQLSAQPPAADGILQVKHGDTLVAVYVDENDGSGGTAEVRATAFVDDVPPLLSGVRVDAVRDTSVVVCWDTDEPADGIVEYGPTPALGFTVAHSVFTTSHALRITNLSPDCTYYYAISSTDEAGNTSRLCTAVMAFHTRWATGAFFDDVEPGGPAAMGKWRSEVLTGRVQPWERSRADSHSKHYSWHADDAGFASASVLDTPEIDLAQVAIPQLTFWHRILSERNYDGGFVQISVDGGLYWQELSQGDMIQGTPYGRLGATCPTPRASGWSGDIAWEKVIFDLADYGGRRIILRFRMESDAAVDVADQDGWFIDDITVTGIHGMIALDRSAYRPGDTAWVAVFDGKANAEHGRGRLSPVLVRSGLEPWGEKVLAAKDNMHPAAFTGRILLAAGGPRPDGTLQVAPLDLITAEYSNGKETFRETAYVDGLPPQIRDIRVVAATPNSVTLAWDTDEPTDGRISYGLTAELGLQYYDARYRTNHLVTLGGLKRTTIYYFKLLCSDRAGNSVMDDNQGRLHSFVTGGFELSGTISEDMTLVAIPGHAWVVVDDTTVELGVTVTVEPGAVLKFGKGGRNYNNCSLWVYGSFNAVGTADKPIVFTSIRDDSVWGDTNGDGSATQPAAGDWGTVYLAGASGSVRVLEHCLFKYGGWDGGQERGALECRQKGIPVRNCRFEQNVFPICFTLGAQPTLTGLQLRGNQFSGLWLRPAAQMADGVLDLVGIPYIFWSRDGWDVVITTGRSLTIMPGVVIKVGGNVQKTSVMVYGSLSVLGTPEAPVIFTSLKDDSILGDTDGDGGAVGPRAGDWGRIGLNGAALLNHCIIRYAGWDDRECAAVECLDTSPELRYCEISASAHGLEAAGGAPLISNCTIALNSGSGLVFDAESAEFSVYRLRPSRRRRPGNRLQGGYGRPSLGRLTPGVRNSRVLRGFPVERPVRAALKYNWRAIYPIIGGSSGEEAYIGDCGQALVQKCAGLRSRRWSQYQAVGHGGIDRLGGGSADTHATHGGRGRAVPVLDRG